MNVSIRLATLDNVPVLERLIPDSVRALQASDYSGEQIEAALGTVFGVDRQLIRDGTYFIAAVEGEVAGCGGWNRRKTEFGSDRGPVKDDRWLQPEVDAARVRAFFVNPRFARKGIGRRILDACEQAARQAGFSRLELVATLTGYGLYQACGFEETERFDVPLSNGTVLPVIRMQKSLA
jgi:GNAT superfamily N-acetyltransferase